ncbi:MAG: hypothetical protein CMJ75_18655 [Planctomycetaceae bacterium]|nr:hypothetical protein [Planctomycetaceae bacterium]
MSADSNRVALRYWEEVTFGAAATGTPTFKSLRLTGESLNQATSSSTSNELRSDRQVSDLIRTGVNAAGAINGEISYGAYDDFFQYALLSSGWSTEQEVSGTTFSVTAGSGSYVIADSGSGFGSFAVGQWVYIKGFASNDNNGWAKISAASAGSITVTNNGDGSTVIAGPTVTITMGAQIVNGTTLTTLNIEKEFEDLSNEFELSTGMSIESFNVSVTSDAILTCAFNFLGKSQTSNTATVGDGSPTAAPTDGVMNAIDNVVAVYENGSTYDVTQLSFDLNNNLRARLQVGTLGAISLGTGTVSVTGAHQGYYASKTVMDKYLNDTVSSLAFIFVKDTDAYVIEFPQIKYSSGQRVAGGINQDIIADMQWTAYRDPTEGITVRIQRFTADVT